MTIEILEEVLEKDLEEAVEVKNKEALKRYVRVLVSSFSPKNDIVELKSDVRIIAETVKQGFELMEKRFEDMNKRFDDVNKRFDDMAKMFRTVMWIIGIGFVVINALIVIFKFLD